MGSNIDSSYKNKGSFAAVIVISPSFTLFIKDLWLVTYWWMNNVSTTYRGSLSNTSSIRIGHSSRAVWTWFHPRAIFPCCLSRGGLNWSVSGFLSMYTSPSHVKLPVSSDRASFAADESWWFVRHRKCECKDFVTAWMKLSIADGNFSNLDISSLKVGKSLVSSL